MLNWYVMNRWGQKQTGFTIVELLIVVVVIAILAAITIVAYNGIKDRAVTSSVQAGLEQATKKVLAYAAVNGDVYPDTLQQAGITNTSSVSYQYSVDNSTNPKAYAITASNGVAGSTSFYLSSTQSKMTSGIAPGHNLVAWDKPKTESVPIAMDGGVAVDTGVFRNSTASIRISPASSGKTVRNTPITGDPGQIVTVSFWILTDAAWNGTAGNSKVRFGSNPGGNLLSTCSYEGAKTTWTLVTCNRTLNSTNSSVNISVGNDGSTGNIWLDDFSVSLK